MANLRFCDCKLVESAVRQVGVSEYPLTVLVGVAYSKLRRDERKHVAVS